MQASGAKLNVILLDCCRVFEGMYRSTRATRATGSGLCEIEAPDGSIIGYACAPNKVAADGGDERNGVFTKHLLKHVVTHGKEVRFMLGAVKRGVREETGGEQIPHVETSLEDEPVCLC